MTTLQGIRARRIMTMVEGQPDIDDGLLLHRDGEIVDVGPFRDVMRTRLASGVAMEDLGGVTLAPGLINAHTHLELAHLHGRTVSGQGFATWVRSLLSQPPEYAMDATDPEAMARACAAMRATGTVFAGDVTSRTPHRASAAMHDAGIGHVLFLEIFGHCPPAFGPEGALGQAPGDLPPHAPPGARYLPAPRVAAHAAMAGHALYSTSPEALCEAKAWDTAHGKPFSMHLAEHEGEEEMLATGRGAFADLLRERGVAPDGYSAPGMSPVAWADTLGLLDADTLAVHCVRCSRADAALLAQRGTSVCLCPRSNAFIGVGRAPFAELEKAGVNLCLGTDSLASNHDLDLWREAIFCLENGASHSSLRQALMWLTVNPARALKVDHVLGRLMPGMRAAYSVVPDSMAVAAAS
ncbi:MAG: amidohydrolase family protein [Desulfovibrionaceae bacterium]